MACHTRLFSAFGEQLVENERHLMTGAIDPHEKGYLKVKPRAGLKLPGIAKPLPRKGTETS